MDSNGSDASTELLAPVESPTSMVRLAPIVKQTVMVPIRGVTPIIPNKFPEKAKEMMRQAQMGPKVKPQHEPKNPQEAVEASCYYLPDGVTPGMPAVAFKAALVGACRLFVGLTMTQARVLFHVAGEGPDQLVALEGERFMREDTPRNANGSTDLRYRYTYWPWGAVLPISFVPSLIDLESVLNLVNAGGMGGVGDWRPAARKSNTGTYGQFEIDPDRELGVIATS